MRSVFTSARAAGSPTPDTLIYVVMKLTNRRLDVLRKIVERADTGVPATSAQVAEELRMPRPNMTAHTDILSSLGLIEFECDPQNGRTRWLKPTAAGRAALGA